MRKLKQSPMLIVVGALLLVGGMAGCKTAGTAATTRGQVMHIGIDHPESMAEGETAEIRVAVENRGVNKLSNVVYRVSFPPQLVVLDESHGGGMTEYTGIDDMGQPVYHYDVGDIEVAQESVAKFKVRAAFGGNGRTGNIRVTAWDADLPGGKLIETASIDLK